MDPVIKVKRSDDEENYVKIFIDDVDEKYLQFVLKLEFCPTILRNEESNELIHIINCDKSKFQPNKTYVIDLDLFQKQKDLIEHAFLMTKFANSGAGRNKLETVCKNTNSCLLKYDEDTFKSENLTLLISRYNNDIYFTFDIKRTNSSIFENEEEVDEKFQPARARVFGCLEQAVKIVFDLLERLVP